MIHSLKIINYLGKNLPNGFTMHDLSKKVGIPYASFYRYVKQLTDQKVLRIKLVGQAKVVTLNLTHPVLKAHLVHSSFAESQEFLKTQPIIRKIAHDLDTRDIVIVFGSYAKGKQMEKSDIDMLIINKDGKRTISFSKAELLYKKKINPIFITKKEFRDMLKENEENVGKQVLKYHIILNNPDKFWEVVLSGI